MVFLKQNSGFSRNKKYDFQYRELKQEWWYS